MNTPKVALFYDWLNQWGGAERVLLDILKIFPNAPVYTLVHDPDKTTWLPSNTKIIPSFLNNFPLAKKNLPLYAPLYPIVLEQFDFSDFDIVISTSTTVGHCLLTPPGTLYLAYFHNLNRRLYPAKFPLNLYQNIDKIYSSRPDYFLASSKNVQNKIKKFYHQPSKLIYPGVDLSKFTPVEHPSGNYFLVVSRLVPHKKVDLAIKACQKLNLPLKIVGTGRQFSVLKKYQTKNIQFLGQINQSKLISLYQNCSALLCPQHEDFGLTAIEAMACGRPVIAYAKGGFLETVINYQTGLLFSHQNISSLVSALKKFKSANFDPKVCRHQAQKFSQKSFMLNFKRTVNKLWPRQNITS
ncbi:glycosyltransferase [Patescibacteria group bacterium]|nr:glycosyltransferase [Patescibacteria group bacterium]